MCKWIDLLFYIIECPVGFFFFIKEKVAHGNISLKKGRKDNCDYEHGVGSMPKLHSVAFLFFIFIFLPWDV